MPSNSPNPSSGPTVSSQLGRKWLVASDEAVALDEPSTQQVPSADPSTGNSSNEQTMDKLAIAEKESSAGVGGTVFISVPDVTSSIGDAFTMLDYSLMNDPADLAEAFVKASEERLTAVSEQEGSDRVEPSAADTLRVLLSPETAKSKLDGSARDDLSEPPAEWTDRPSTNDPPRKDSEKPSKQTGTDQAIEKLVNAIVDRFPLGDPTVLVFVGSESNKHIDETCARVASMLAERKIGRILLLDSDTEGHELSNASGVSGQPGITNIANEAVEWESTIYGRSATGLDFLACGTGGFRHADSSDRLRNAVAEMKREYQFICVSAGDARSPSARIWHDICDGSYLLVSMKNSNQTIAKSAVAEMQTSGARLLGCVVTDVD